ncbi:hypothetical protein [Pseudoleptotrichia goodfellowii]|jgi:hypothetical protein|uniref:Uncharacterized protein n=1 Tax=Pseudoleptotrichia goodfellowii TaxID=157692 RepID=A0A510J821_9FUSO|nr:hypothetical protein [Pseudoleptotrichia goodfellowii]BBM35450.1 hypothetical protein JCM16774_0363 [Pseudoleptotrichia goodfellowii]DAS43164.1 MAG TPA: hypothetical protein [Caudoviricetes sp.]
MKVKIISDLPEMFIISQVITEKGNILKFTKGILETELNEENLQKIKKFLEGYGKRIQVLTETEAEGINNEKIVNKMNKETELKQRKAGLLSELELVKKDLKEISKKDIIEKFKQYVNDENVKKEELIKQIEENIEKIEG